jgi:hypothetical protein
MDQFVRKENAQAKRFTEGCAALTETVNGAVQRVNITVETWICDCLDRRLNSGCLVSCRVVSTQRSRVFNFAKHVIPQRGGWWKIRHVSAPFTWIKVKSVDRFYREDRNGCPLRALHTWLARGLFVGRRPRVVKRIMAKASKCKGHYLTSHM